MQNLQPTDLISAMMRTSLDCIVLLDEQARIVDLNPAIEGVFGYTRNELLGFGMGKALFPADDKNSFQHELERYSAVGNAAFISQRIEVMATHKSGRPFPVELTVTPTILDDQQIFLLVLRDISEQKINEQLIKKSSARLTQLIENLAGGVLVEDETRHIALINQAFCDMFQIPVPAQALIGVDCAHSADNYKVMFTDPAMFINRIEVILRDQKTVIDEIVYLVDGRVFSRDYVPVVHNEIQMGHLWHYRDVTKIYQAQRRWERMVQFEGVDKEINRLFLQLDDVDDALNQALALTGQLLDVSRVYVFRFRENERVLDNTHEWCAPGVKPEIDNLKGFPFDDILPSFFPMISEYDLIAPRHINELPDDIRGLLEPQDIQTILWVPLYLNQRIEGFLGYDETRHAREWFPEEITMARIITMGYARALERQQSAHMLIDARDEAVRTAQLRAQFIANMSHEIRTPMTGSLGMLELLLETGLDELQREFATEAFNSASRLLAIINEILDFSKLEAGQVVLDAESIDLRAIATEVKMTLASQVKRRAITFGVQIDSQVPYRVFGDATRIRQVLMNLVGNAVKFTHEGQINIHIDLITIIDDVAFLSFSVQDTGIGIEPEKLDHIFASFVQGDGSTTRKYGGTGLGLSISKQIVELMGGSFYVESELGKGSTFNFKVRLPIAQIDGSERPNLGFERLSVLVIDHNRTTRYVLKQQLEVWGVRVVAVEDIQDLPLRHASNSPEFDLTFFHQTKEDQYTRVNHINQFAPQTIVILDGLTPLKPLEAPSLRWPIEQSVLYNMLVKVVYQATPATPEEFGDIKPVPQTSSYQGQILVADDHALNIELVRRGLAMLNVQIDAVENGQELLEMLEKNTYDLILMDIQMPIMDGIEATRRIRRSDTPYRSIPILAFTARVMREQQEHYMSIGIDEIIKKPFSLTDLRDVIKRWLQKVQAAKSGEDAP